MMKIQVMGHSHVAALQRCQSIHPQVGATFDFIQCREPQFAPLLVDGDDLNPNLVARIRAHPADLHVSMLGGNESSVLSMLAGPRRFDVVLPEAPDLPFDDEAEIIPAGLVIAELKRRTAPLFKALATYRALASGPVVQVESPPPVPSEDHIRRYPGAFSAEIDKYGVSSSIVRYKFWRLQSHVFASGCAELGVKFLPTPPEMCDERGMLAEVAWNLDPTHGNAEYGRAVIAQLMREVA